MPLTEESLLTLLIQSIELREIRLPLVHFFETSFGRTTERRIVLARVTDANGAEGWGECTAGEGPFYSNEWTETAWATLIEFLGPMMLRKEFESAAHVFNLMKPVRGHRMAKATLETLPRRGRDDRERDELRAQAIGQAFGVRAVAKMTSRAVGSAIIRRYSSRSWP